MKKFYIVFILILLFVLLSAACSGNKQIPKTDAVLAGKVVQLYDNSFLLAGKNAADLYMVTTRLKIYDANNKTADISALKTGQEVEIGYSGSVMESYPAQLSEPVYIKITGQGGDLVGFYQAILNDLWNVDAGLNPDSGVLAFDLSQVVNLSDAEKSALVYIVSGDHGLTGITGTFNELSEQGYINKEKLYFENGMLFTFELTNVTVDSFKFDAKKWRSGTGAYFFRDCKAVKSGDDWSYKVGSVAISKSTADITKEQALEKAIKYYPKGVGFQYAGQDMINDEFHQKGLVDQGCYIFDVNYNGKHVSSVAVGEQDGSMWFLDMGDCKRWFSESFMGLPEIDDAEAIFKEPIIKIDHNKVNNTVDLYFARLDTISELSNKNEGGVLWNEKEKTLQIRAVKVTGTVTGSPDGPTFSLIVSWADGEPIVKSIEYQPAPAYSQPSQVIYSGEILSIENDRLIEIAEYFRGLILLDRPA